MKSGKFSIGFALLGLLTLAAGVWTERSQAQSVPSDINRGASGLERDLLALRTRASMIHITAHPDDEDGGMLAYETRGKGVRGVLLTLNRGEGGQNEMSDDLYDSLGLVRTQELLMADRYYGVSQYWSRVADYGFSKTREEALEKWGHDRVLSDVVRVVRMTRPLVVTSVFVGASTDGHGQHQVAGQMAQEVYLAAGDPTKFPEQIREGLRPWQPLKIYEHVPFFAPTKEGMYDYAIDKYVPVRFFDYITQKWSDTRPETTLEIPEGSYAGAPGLTFAQISREGWGYQKSQNGGGTIPPPEINNSEYHRYASRVTAAEHESSFFDGIDVSLNGIASLAQGDTGFLKSGLARMSKSAEDAWSQYSAAHPAGIAPVLADGLKATDTLLDQVRNGHLAEPGKSDVIYELDVKQKQFETALVAALGLRFEAVVAPDAAPSGPFAGRGGGQTATFTIAIPGQSFGVDATLFNPSGDALNASNVTVGATDGKAWTVQPVKDSKDPAGRWRFHITTPADAALTRPYFTRPNDEQPYYDLTDPKYRNLPLAPYPLIAHATVTYRGASFEMHQDVEANRRINGVGLVADPLLVGPAISVTVSPSAGAVPLSSKSFDFTCTIHSNVKGPAQGVLQLKLPSGWRSQPPELPFAFSRDGEDKTVTFSVSPDVVKSAEYTITAVAEYNGRSYTEGYHLTGYGALRPYPDYRPATYRAVGVDVKTAPGMQIGFFPGTGDDVPRALENLGQNVQVLAASDLLQGDLKRYDTIILGTRAYAVRPELRSANNRLLDYVKNGGVLIVQYNLQDFDHNYGPYPFSLGQNPQKVVDEDSPVKILDPSSPVFAWPNPITAADFKGWVEERGHGFMKTWDSHYTPLVETHDPDQDPQLGGLLVARYGKGFYVYDAFALYRQLPSGVPGSYRLLANLVSLGKNPEWK